jgi:hypothetical protein
MFEKKKEPRQDKEFYDQIRREIREKQEKEAKRRKEAQETFERMGIVVR